MTAAANAKAVNLLAHLPNLPLFLISLAFCLNLSLAFLNLAFNFPSSTTGSETSSSTTVVSGCSSEVGVAKVFSFSFSCSNEAWTSGSSNLLSKSTLIPYFCNCSFKLLFETSFITNLWFSKFSLSISFSWLAIWTASAANAKALFVDKASCSLNEFNASSCNFNSFSASSISCSFKITFAILRLKSTSSSSSILL